MHRRASRYARRSERVKAKVAFGVIYLLTGRVGLVARSGLRSRNVPSSKPDTAKDVPFMWARCTSNLMSWVKCPFTDVVRKIGEAVPVQVSSSSSPVHPCGL
ncbi:hypothetical protein AVEN_106079-1 [Araneus ventricosus]|uniref:Uncharacterized protein n=1 Tax=Araneus ventricosus TaxID=182803 RepID=A0A4Y2NWL1_ARAVE|nr:hypothetical protein AVEN_106079-1 [Araneus ventricosus]